MKNLRILFCASEAAPYAKTGGLADVADALPAVLKDLGCDVRLFIPFYRCVRDWVKAPKLLPAPSPISVGIHDYRVNLLETRTLSGIPLYLLEKDEFFDRSYLYGSPGAGDYEDNAERFITFCRAIHSLCHALRWSPSILHLHDWQTALAAAYHRTQWRHDPLLADAKTILTIHNLAYQGLFPAAQYGLTNLPAEYFNLAGVEFYGQLGCLKAGIVYADIITTVSPRYAREITTEEMGCGLDGLLRQRNSSLVGILNGVDADEWNPQSDPHLKHAYSAADLRGKEMNKLELQREFGLPIRADIPLFGSIGRLAEQKGVEILLAALEETLGAKMQFIVVGSGAPTFEKAYRDLARRYPSQVGVQIGFNEGLSHRIEAGSDFFLMPSRFEPCGLNQMYGLRYGAIPIVRATGGLDDTVIDIREDSAKANGIKFMEYSPAALVKSIHKALALFEEPHLMQQFRHNGMTADFSWNRVVSEYIRIYEKIGT